MEKVRAAILGSGNIGTDLMHKLKRSRLLVPTISIDLDKKCEECRHSGAAENGLCLPCTTKAIQGKPMTSYAGRAVASRFRRKATP